jgi:hypothetical protein
MIAGLAAFVLGGGLVSLAELNFGLPGSVILINFAVGLALTPPSTVAGAALYKEAAAPAAMSAGTGR